MRGEVLLCSQVSANESPEIYSNTLSVQRICSTVLDTKRAINLSGASLTHRTLTLLQHPFFFSLMSLKLRHQATEHL